jgi:hypothetical protein
VVYGFVSENEKQEFSHLEKQELCHIYGCFLGWLCVLIDLFDVFMDFVSENLKNRNFLTFLDY